MPITRWEEGKQDALAESFRSDLEVARSLASFIDDPPDSNYQRGFLAGLRERFIKMQKTVEPRSGGKRDA